MVGCVAAKFDQASKTRILIEAMSLAGFPQVEV